MKKVIIAEDVKAILEADAILFEGDTVRCSFSLPDSMHITANAEVVRVLPEDTEHDTNWYAIKFTDLSADAISAIEAFVNKECQHT